MGVKVYNDIELEAGSSLVVRTDNAWTNSDRSIPFGVHNEPTHIAFENVDSAKGLTYNPNTGAVKAGSFVKRGGTSSQFLKADGSVDSHSYLTSHQDISGKADKSNVISAVKYADKKLYCQGGYGNANDVVTAEQIVKDGIIVENNNIQLSFDTETEIADICGNSIKVKLPANPNTDYRVRQTDATNNVNRPLLMAYANNTTQQDQITYKNTGIYANSQTKVITAGGFAHSSVNNNEYLLGAGGGLVYKPNLKEHEYIHVGEATNPNWFIQNYFGEFSVEKGMFDTFVIGKFTASSNPFDFSYLTYLIMNNGFTVSKKRFHIYICQVQSLSYQGCIGNSNYSGSGMFHLECYFHEKAGVWVVNPMIMNFIQGGYYTNTEWNNYLNNL